uniref:Cytochrome P450 n=1 Tax=Leersia perrieri TaxID=77586 RepID=A0A0D9VAA1_9ORYZ
MEYSLFLFVLVVVILLLRRCRRRTRRNNNHRPPRANLVAFLVNGHRFLDWSTTLLAAAPASTMEVYGPLGSGHRGVTTANPAVVEHIVRGNFHNYVKGDRIKTAFADLLGDDGIFLADGRRWILQRKLASYSFSPRVIRRFAARVVGDQLRRRLLPFFAAAADDGRVFDLQDLLRRFTFDNICSFAFGVDHDSSSAAMEGGGDRRDSAFFAAFDDAVDISFGRILHPTTVVWKVMKLLDVGSERRLRRAIAVVDEYVTTIMADSSEQRRRRCSDEEEEEPDDLLSRFTAAMEEDDGDGDGELGEMFSSPAAKQLFLRDTVKTFAVAAVEDTYYDELKKMHYLHASITETMRLYPPVPMASRVAAAGDVLPDGTAVEAGWFADYSSYAMGRMKSIWGEDCGEFRPERWLNGDAGGGEFVGVDAARYPVFHGGPRSCLGKEMAYVQMKAVADAVIRRFAVEVVAPPRHEMAVTLRMKGGLRVRVSRRRAVSSGMGRLGHVIDGPSAS